MLDVRRWGRRRIRTASFVILSASISLGVCLMTLAFHPSSAIVIDFPSSFRFYLFVLSVNNVSSAVQQSLRSIVSGRAKPVDFGF